MSEMKEIEQEIALDMIEPNPFQARSVFRETEIEELAESINSVGLLNRVLLRPHPEKKGYYQLVHGERRVRAFQVLERETIPAKIQLLSDREMIEINLIENLQRENLNPIEEANGYLRMKKEFGYTQTQIAQIIGKSQPYIANCLRILKLPKFLQNDVLYGVHSPWEALVIGSLKDEYLITRLTYLSEDWQMSVHELKEAVKSIKEYGCFEIVREIPVKGILDCMKYYDFAEICPYSDDDIERHILQRPELIPKGIVKYFETDDFGAMLDYEREIFNEKQLNEPICVGWWGFYTVYYGLLKVKIWESLNRELIESFVDFSYFSKRAAEVFGFDKDKRFLESVEEIIVSNADE